MYPHERSLVKRYRDRPFALLGVNVGDAQSLLRELRKDDVITWRFWIDRPPAPITQTYQVEGFPGIFLLDHRGVIRDKDLRNMDVLDDAVEHLVREAELQQKSS